MAESIMTHVKEAYQYDILFEHKAHKIFSLREWNVIG